MEGWLTTQFNLQKKSKGSRSKGGSVGEDVGLTLGGNNKSDSDNDLHRHQSSARHDDRKASYSGSRHTLFDDVHAGDEHIVSADMGSLHFGDHNDPTTRVLHANFLDFGTDLRPRLAPSRTSSSGVESEGRSGTESSAGKDKGSVMV